MSKLKPYSIIFSGHCNVCNLFVSGSGAFIPTLACPTPDCDGNVKMKKKLVVDEMEKE